MPLAIELAAARIKLLTPDQILARLDHHLATADRRLARPAGAPADPARRDRLELRPARRRGAPAARPAVGLPRRVRPRRWPRRVCGPADEIGGDVVDRIGELVDQSLVRLDDGPRAAVRDARDDPRVRRRDAGDARRGGGRRATATPRPCSTSRSGQPPSCRARTSGSGWSASSATTTTCARRSTGRSRSPTRTLGARLSFALWRFWQQRGYLNEARARFEQMAAQGWELDPVRPGAVRGGVRGHRLLAVGPGRRPPACTTSSSGSGRRSATGARSPTRCSTGPTPT